MEKICNGELVKDFRCSPDRLDLEKAKDFITKYLTRYRKLKLPYHIRMAIRHFLASKGIVIPRGFGSHYGLSGEKESYGKYAHVKLSENQIAQINEIMANEPIALEKGYDIGFKIGIQTCSRAFAIGSINVNRIWREENLYIVEVFEPKIKENDEYLGYKGKWWRKYITKSLYERIQQFIEQHPKRTLLFTNKEKKTHVLYWLGTGIYYKKGFRGYLREIYRKIGIKEKYFYLRPIHALRHAGAHILLRKTNYNYSIVAKLGGWKTPQILEECYGYMPDEVITNVIRRLEE